MNARGFAIAGIAYFALVLVLGGSTAGGLLANAFLQAAGGAMIGWAMLLPAANGERTVPPRLFLIATAVLLVAQLPLLPPPLWTWLPGRAPVADALKLIGAPLPWQGMSLSWWHSLASAAWAIPAFATYLIFTRAGGPSPIVAARVAIIVALFGVLLAIAQRFAGAAYIYEASSVGTGVGLFANANHHATFLLFTALLAVASARQAAPVRRNRRTGGPMVLGLVVAAILAAGVGLTGSLAGLLLLAPAIGIAVLIVRPQWRPSLPVLAGITLAVAAVPLLFLFYGPVSNDLTTVQGSYDAELTRQAFLNHGATILKNVFPFGSGLGTFPAMYQRFEDPARVVSIYVNHAHDDLLELLVDTGIFGLVALVTFLAWWVGRLRALWRGPSDSLGLALAGGMAIAFAHSLVDYPLRTAAMASLMALGIAYLARGGGDDGADAKRGRAR